jgi:Protein of unknown function (DUF3089)
MLSLHAPRRPRAAAFVLALVATALLAATASASAGASPVWLCRPGLQPDPCTPGLSTTVYSAKLHKLGVRHPQAIKHPAIDCFYVYPTVSDQTTGNANLHIDPEERSIALYQAARYSQYCKVYAPMYRQVTLAGIGSAGKPTTPVNPALALSSVRSAFASYLAHDNHGRGFVLIGHSQGSFILRQLIAKDVDPKPAVRRRLLSAILLGGNVLVKPGRRGIGGDFKHIAACRSNTQLGCVIAFSTFDQPVPKASLFGRPSRVLGAPAGKGDIVLCTNPAALAGGSAIVAPILPSAPFAPGTLIAVGNDLLKITQPHPPTVWFTQPDAYSAQCVNSNGAHVLMLKALHGAQVASPAPNAAWGLHLLDANIALGNLISIVHSESIAYAQQQVVAP